MCIFTAPVLRVSNTCIFACHSSDGVQQLIVYSNEVATKEPNAMVLPVPAAAASIQLIDLSSYQTIFMDMYGSFPLRKLLHGLKTMEAVACGPDGVGRQLAQTKVGSFMASVLPSLSDFCLLDSAFKLQHDLLELLSRHYADGFSFIVCRLTLTGLSKYHPFAYTHALAPDGQLFIPTRHFHRPHRTLCMRLARALRIASTSAESTDADWDHEVYLLDAELAGPTSLATAPDAVGHTSIAAKCSSVRWELLPTAFRPHAEGSSLLSAWDLKGTSIVNDDLHAHFLDNCTVCEGLELKATHPED